MPEFYTAQSDIVLTHPVLLTLHPAAVYLSSLTSGSRRTMRKALDVIARMLTNDASMNALSLDWSKLRSPYVAAIRSVLMEQYAPATANRMLCALRRTLKEAQRLGFISADEYARLVDFKSVRGDSPLRGRVLKPSEIATLLENCRRDTDLIGDRDAALIAILAGSGLRRSEAVALDLADFDAAAGSMQVLAGKGKKVRTVYLPSGALAAVQAWIKVRGTDKGPLICPVMKGNHVKVRRMTDQAVMAILLKRGVQAGVLDFSPHDFRRTFISELLDAGANVLTVSKLAGHADPATTQKYDLRGEEAKRKAVQLLQIPYLGNS